MPAVKAKESMKESLAAVVAHPLRAQVFCYLAERTASPRQMATALKRELGHVSYQVSVLKDLGLIEEVGNRPVRGATEHFYRAIERPLVSAEEYAELDQDERNDFAREICQLGFADAAAALATTVLSSRPDNCVARTPLLVDEQGWSEIAKLHEDVVLRTMQIEAESNQRRAENNESVGVHVESFVLFYERSVADQSD